MEPKRTILVIEDEEMLRDLLSGFLEFNGFQVITAADGAEAIEVYGKRMHAIDLVLSDMGLPKLSGWETFITIKTMNPDVKFVVASGFVEGDAKQELLRAGVKAVVQKPYVPAQIVEVVRGVLGSDRSRE